MNPSTGQASVLALPPPGGGQPDTDELDQDLAHAHRHRPDGDRRGGTRPRRGLPAEGERLRVEVQPGICGWERAPPLPGRDRGRLPQRRAHPADARLCRLCRRRGRAGHGAVAVDHGREGAEHDGDRRARVGRGGRPILTAVRGRRGGRRSECCRRAPASVRTSQAATQRPRCCPARWRAPSRARRSRSRGHAHQLEEVARVQACPDDPGTIVTRGHREPPGRAAIGRRRAYTAIRTGLAAPTRLHSRPGPCVEDDQAPVGPRQRQREARIVSEVRPHRRLDVDLLGWRRATAGAEPRAQQPVLSVGGHHLPELVGPDGQPVREEADAERVRSARVRASELTRPTVPSDAPARHRTGRWERRTPRGRREHRPDADVQPVRRVALEDGGDAQRIAPVRLECRARVRSAASGGAATSSRVSCCATSRSRDRTSPRPPCCLSRWRASRRRPRRTPCRTRPPSPARRSSPDCAGRAAVQKRAAPGWFGFPNAVDHDAGIDADLVARGVAQTTEDVAPVLRVVAAGGPSGNEHGRQRRARDHLAEVDRELDVGPPLSVAGREARTRRHVVHPERNRDATFPGLAVPCKEHELHVLSVERRKRNRDREQASIDRNAPPRRPRPPARSSSPPGSRPTRW